MLIAADGKELIPPAVMAALGARTFAQASKPLSDDQKDLLSRALRMDVDEFRAQFAAQLRATGAGLIDLLQARMNELKPGEIPFALSVMVDKAAALDGRASLQNASVNIQVNNYGVTAKDSLLGDLDGLTGVRNVSKDMDVRMASATTQAESSQSNISATADQAAPDHAIPLETDPENRTQNVQK